MNAEPFFRLSIPTARLRINWGRQNTQSLQAVLAVAPLKKGKQLGDVRLFVCVSRTICVCKGEKWFRTFVRGTVRTENEIVSVCVHCPLSSQYNLC